MSGTYTLAEIVNGAEFVVSPQDGHLVVWSGGCYCDLYDRSGGVVWKHVKSFRLEDLPRTTDPHHEVLAALDGAISTWWDRHLLHESGWRHSHTLHTVDGETPVYLVDGSLYTAAEWTAFDTATWTYTADGLLAGGEVVNGAYIESHEGLELVED